MKFCPQCMTGFPDHSETCPTHGIHLSEIIDLKPGMLIRNTYRIVRKLGEGGMGAVYLAEHTLMDEQRALKFLSRQWSRDEAFTARFRREVRTLRQVRHKNVIDSGDLERAEDEALFFAMEFVDGPDLRSFLHHAPQPFDVRLALELARGIAEGLGAAHAKGMVHRDIKPENVLMAREGDTLVPKIADFGIVATKESSITRTRTGASLLTYAYAAPEQWRGMKSAELDGRTDLYALGGVLFEMLTGQNAFDAESYEGWAEQHKNAVPLPPSSLRPELAHWRGLDALTLRLLAKEREDRPKDVAEVLSLLSIIEFVPAVRQDTMPEYKATEPIRQPVLTEPLPTPRPEPSHQPVEAMASDSGEQFDSQKHIHITKGLWIRRVPAWQVILAVLLLIGAIALLKYFSNPSPDATTQTTSSIQQPQPQPLPPKPPAPPALKGSVMDISGAVIPGAKVTVFLTDGSGRTLKTTSNENGRYSFTSLPTQTVKVSVEAAGFRKLTYNRVELKNGQIKRLNITMGVGSSTEEVVINVLQ
jgi:serine/threonine-protein kinase